MTATARRSGAPDLLVVGDANPDVLVSGAPETPPAGQAETLVDSGTLALGGSAAIVAHGAARLGLSTALVAMVGRDAAGDFVLDTLSAAGVDISGCTRHDSLPTALTVCLNRPDGDRAILTAPGCLPAFGPEHVPDLTARHVHAASYFLQPRLAAGLPRLLADAAAGGASTSLDTNDDPAGTWRLAPGLAAACTFLLPNEAEALALAGALGAQGAAEPAGALRGRGDEVLRGRGDGALGERGDRGPGGPAGTPGGAGDRGPGGLDDALGILRAAGPVPVVKRGRHGAVARIGAQDVTARGPEVVPVDTVGAGDGFDAGFLAGWLDSGDLPQALAWGCACGALSTRAAGGTAAQAGRDEATALAARVEIGVKPLTTA
ncbi:carbohydrate kinase family protein [Actinoallomurus spadix]|uniref:Carbohydrate kinase PfkB domain-containing protein n=1 Tax=Actinoallomurus spadix TaxID=79912 RepID=A0ABP3HMR1_9ACTN